MPLDALSYLMRVPCLSCSEDEKSDELDEKLIRRKIA